MKEQIHYIVNTNWLCQYYISKEYEYLTQIGNYEYKYIHYYPLWNLFQQKVNEGYDFESDLTEFLSNHLYLSTDVAIDNEMLELFARKWLRKQMECTEYIQIRDKRKRGAYLKHREEQITNMEKSGVWNKETDEFVEAEFGDHWNQVSKMIVDKFGEHPFYIDRKKWDEVDEWITKNIVLIGCFLPEAYYRMKSHYNEA